MSFSPRTTGNISEVRRGRAPAWHRRLLARARTPLPSGSRISYESLSDGKQNAFVSKQLEAKVCVGGVGGGGTGDECV